MQCGKSADSVPTSARAGRLSIGFIQPLADLKIFRNRIIKIHNIHHNTLDFTGLSTCGSLVYPALIADLKLTSPMAPQPLPRKTRFNGSYTSIHHSETEINKRSVYRTQTLGHMANAYLLNWTITAYYAGEDLNDYEYIACLKHNVRLLEWIEANKGEFARLRTPLNLKA